MSSCCNGNCGCGANCTCGSGCKGCGRSETLVLSKEMPLITESVGGSPSYTSVVLGFGDANTCACFNYCSPCL